MELILKSNNEQSIAKLIALAKKLNVVIEQQPQTNKADTIDTIKNRILNFQAKSSSFGDIDKWQKEQREDRNLPFS